MPVHRRISRTPSLFATALVVLGLAGCEDPMPPEAELVRLLLDTSEETVHSIGRSARFCAIAVFSDGFDRIVRAQWSLSDTDVARIEYDPNSHCVDIRALADGTVTVTAEYRTMSVEGSVTIQQAVTELELERIPIHAILTGGIDTLELTASAVDAAETPMPPERYEWSLSDSTVARIESDGGAARLMGTGEGEVVITVAVDTISASDTVGIGRWVHYTSDNSGLAGNAVERLAIDSVGTAWVGLHNGGVQAFDGLRWTPRYTTDNSPLPDNVILSLSTDSTDAVWIGTPHGLARFDGEDWAVWTAENSGLIADDHGQLWILGVTPAPDGTVWFLNSRTEERPNQAPVSRRYVGRVVDGTTAEYLDSVTVHGEYIAERGSCGPTSPDVIPLRQTMQIVVDPEGTVWMAGTRNTYPLFRVDDESGSRLEATGFPPEAGELCPEGRAFDMAAAPDGELFLYYRHTHEWPALGNDDFQLLAFDGASWRFGYTTDGQTNLAVDDESVWLGLSGDGIRRFDRATLSQQEHHQPGNSPLPSARVFYGLEVDSKGVLWVGMRGGVLRYLPE